MDEALSHRGRSGAAFAVWLAWFVVLRVWYGGWPLPPHSDYYFGSPFKGMLFRWTHLDHSGSRISGVLHLLRMLLLTGTSSWPFTWRHGCPIGCWRLWPLPASRWPF